MPHNSKKKGSWPRNCCLWTIDIRLITVLPSISGKSIYWSKTEVILILCKSKFCLFYTTSLATVKLRRKKLDYTLCPYYPHPHIMGRGNSGERKIRSNLPLSPPPLSCKNIRGCTSAQHTTLLQCSTDPHPHAGKAASKSECANSAVLFIILALEVEVELLARPAEHCLWITTSSNLSAAHPKISHFSPVFPAALMTCLGRVAKIWFVAHIMGCDTFDRTIHLISVSALDVRRPIMLLRSAFSSGEEYFPVGGKPNCQWIRSLSSLYSSSCGLAHWKGCEWV